jgi:hypothetical protein
MIHHNRGFWALNKRPTRTLVRDSPAQLCFVRPSSHQIWWNFSFVFVECQVGGVFGRASRARISHSADGSRGPARFEDSGTAIITTMALEMKISHASRCKDWPRVPTPLGYPQLVSNIGHQVKSRLFVACKARCHGIEGSSQTANRRRAGLGNSPSIVATCHPLGGVHYVPKRHTDAVHDSKKCDRSKKSNYYRPN